MSNYFFRFGFPQAFLFLPILLIFWWLYVRKKTTTYIYSRTHMLLSTGLSDGYIFQKILDGMRLLSLLVLIFLIARPQYIDEQSKLEVRGIDIVIALDVSGSMGLQDYADDSRSRFTIAKDEASRFIKKRDNDAIGLVVFGGIALLRCPITMDKKLLLTLVNDLELGDVDPGLTMLARGMLAGINRLKQSSAASKVIILLTDGAPSEGDIDPQRAIEIAKKCGIKVYAIGIGGEQEQLVRHPVYGIVRMPPVNKKLLESIALQTGGRCFMAQNAADMRAIYETIDALEKTEQQMPLFSNCKELFVLPLIGVLLLSFLEQILRTFWWFSI